MNVYTRIAQRLPEPPRVSKRQMLKRRAAALRRMNAPDVLRMVALCPKCPSWFPSVEARNAHRAQDHGPNSGHRRAQEAIDDDASDAAVIVAGERVG